MIFNSLADAVSPRRAINLDTLGGWLSSLNRQLRPADGWLSVILLALNLMVVAWSVAKADWAPTPSLPYLILLAMVTGLVLSRIPLWAMLVLPVGLAIGVLVIVWQLTSFRADNLALANSAELWQRLGTWLQVAKSGNINLDTVPFAFALMALTWLSGYLAAWVFFRYQNFWGVFILGGAGLLSNLTYLPAEASSDLLLYLFTALLLVARVQSVRRRRQWQRRNIQFEGHLGLLSFSDSLFLAIAVLLLAYFLPVRGPWGPANDAYEVMRSPLEHLQDDFNRLFAGLPARRAIPYRVWDDVMAFQGTIYPTTTPVLRVDSKTPMYWKARTYSTYTAQGWVSENTLIKPIDWVPTYALAQPYRSRVEVTYSVTPSYATKSLFAGERVLKADKEVRIETYDSPIYTLDLTDQRAIQALPPKLAMASANLLGAIQASGPSASNSTLAASLPPDFKLLDVMNEQGRVKQVTLAEVLPEQPDVLSLRSAQGNVKPGQTYQITSLISTATAAELRGAGTDYPTWALVKYTQLPNDLPQRVRDLAAQLTAAAPTPYDKAKAIEAYLSSWPYTLQVEPPPHQTDGVDYFLFTLKKGYSEYFASGMTVLLRASGVPARLATGYTVGDKVANQDSYVVTDSNSHAWVEVFFPQYGWIAFEPTPGASLPTAAAQGSSDIPFIPVGGGPGTFDPEDEELDTFIGIPAPPPESWTDELQRAIPWLLSVLLLAGLTTGIGWLWWRRYMIPSADPEVTFRHLAMLGTLGSVGPLPHQTPFQYLERLSEVLPTHRNQVSAIVDAYVRHLYGRKVFTDDERNRLIRAWTSLRGALLLRIVQRLKLR
jgi:hypothetical protein